MNWASIDVRKGFFNILKTNTLFAQKLYKNLFYFFFLSCNDFDKKWVINTCRELPATWLYPLSKQPWLVLWNRQSMVIGKNLDYEVLVDIRGLYVLVSPELKKGEGFKMYACMSVCLFVSSAREITAQSISTILAKNASSTHIIGALKLQYRMIREVGEAANRGPR